MISRSHFPELDEPHWLFHIHGETKAVRWNPQLFHFLRKIRVHFRTANIQIICRCVVKSGLSVGFLLSRCRPPLKIILGPGISRVQRVTTKATVAAAPGCRVIRLPRAVALATNIGHRRINSLRPRLRSPGRFPVKGENRGVAMSFPDSSAPSLFRRDRRQAVLLPRCKGFSVANIR